MLYLIVYKNKDNNTYFYKLKKYGYVLMHELGSKNQYGQQIVLIIPITEEVYKKTHPIQTFKRKILTKISHYINKKLRW